MREKRERRRRRKLDPTWTCRVNANGSYVLPDSREWKIIHCQSVLLVMELLSFYSILNIWYKKEKKKRMQKDRSNFAHGVILWESQSDSLDSLKSALIYLQDSSSDPYTPCWSDFPFQLTTEWTGKWFFSLPLTLLLPLSSISPLSFLSFFLPTSSSPWSSTTLGVSSSLSEWNQVTYCMPI